MHKWYAMTCHLFGWTPVIVPFLTRYKSALRRRFHCTLLHPFIETSSNKLIFNSKYHGSSGIKPSG